MNFTNEQLEKAKQAKTAEEFLALAKENGLELTEEEAKKYFEQWHKEGALSHDELDNVVGGSEVEFLFDDKSGDKEFRIYEGTVKKEFEPKF